MISKKLWFIEQKCHDKTDTSFLKLKSLNIIVIPSECNLKLIS